MITLSELNHKLNHSHTIKIKNFLKQDDSDGRERKFQFLEKLSKPVFNKKMYASIIDYVSETIRST